MPQNNFAHAGELMAILTAFSWSIGMFPFAEAAKRLGPNVLNLFRLVVAVILLGILTIVLTKITFIELLSSPTLLHWLWLGVSGVIGLALGDYFGFSAFATIGPRLSSVFITLAPAVALLFGYFINDERINTIGLIGMFITISGIVWLVMGKKEKAKITHLSKSEYTKGVLYAALAAVCQGIGITLSQKGLHYKIAGENINAIHASLIRMIAATISVLIVAVIFKRLKQIVLPAVQNKNKGIAYAITGTLFGPVIGMALSMQAVSMTSASIAQTIFSLLPVFVLVLAHLFYREKITSTSFFGAVIAILGVVILIWRKVIYAYLS